MKPLNKNNSEDLQKAKQIVNAFFENLEENIGPNSPYSEDTIIKIANIVKQCDMRRWKELMMQFSAMGISITTEPDGKIIIG